MGIESHELDNVSYTDTGTWNSPINIGHNIDKGLASGIIEFAEKFNLKTFWDIGCGDGTYTSLLRDGGLIGDGIDGNPNTPPSFIIGDLTTNLRLSKRDFSICIEVAEHIPQQYLPFFIKNLTDSSDLIILSWASKNQYGAGHVNPKSNLEVINLMKSYNYQCLLKDAFDMRIFCKEWYLKMNILIFKHPKATLPTLKAIT